MTVVQPNQMTTSTARHVGCADAEAVMENYSLTCFVNCDPCAGGCPPGYTTECLGDQQPDDCGCCIDYSPILVDLSGSHLTFSSAEDGVLFTINDVGSTVRVAWPTTPSAAFLVLDRNGDALVNDGAEMFGNTTRLKSGAIAGNGFEALAEFDTDRNRLIDKRDWLYAQLRLWVDLNRNGLSEDRELADLRSAGVLAIGVSPKSSSRRDRWGNRFALRSKVTMDTPPFERYAYDVFPVALKSDGSPVCPVPQNVSADTTQLSYIR